MLPRAWLTIRIVPACPHSSRMRSKDFALKRASPTDRASSMSRMSGSMFTATENASRPYMPDEYVRIGRSMKSPSSANSAISSYLARRSSRRRPAASPPRTTLSRPVSSALKPTPSASSVLTRPWTSTRPRVGGRMPATVRMSVDLPAPLAPMMPSTLPCGTSSDTSSTALISRTTRSRRPTRTSVLRSVGRRSSAVRYTTDRSCTLTAGPAASVPSTAAGVSEPYRKLTLPRDEEQDADDERDRRPGHRQCEPARRRRLASEEHVAPRAQDRRQRVQVRDDLEALRDVLDVVEHRRRVEPDAQQVRQEARDVAEVDGGGGDERGHARREDEEKAEEDRRPQQVRGHGEPRGDVDHGVDDERRKEAQQRGEHRGQRKQHPRERRVQDQPAAARHRLRALGDRLAEHREYEQAGQQVGEEVRPARAVLQDVHEHEVDEREQQRVDDEPELPEDR